MILVITSSVVSGVAGIIISIIYHRQYEKRLVKLSVLRNIFGYKFQLGSNDKKEFNKAINEIPIVFHDSKAVLIAHKNLYETLNSENKDSKECDRRFIDLYKAILKDLKLDLDKYISDEEFLRTLS